MNAPSEETPLVVRRDRPRLRALVVALLVLAGLLAYGRRRSAQIESPHEFVGATMGTSFVVRVDDHLSRGDEARVRSVIEGALDRVSRLMSTYDTASEVSRFNRHASTDPFPVSQELLDVLSAARDVSQRSGGALDVTVAPLVEAWGFGAGGGVDGRLGPRPDEALLSRLRERIGFERLTLDVAGQTLSKADPMSTIDLSAVAKGYGVDAVSDELLGLGLTRFLVEVGGELRATGTTRDGRTWRVGIERPDDAAPGIWGTVDLEDEAIATSGDYRNYYEEDGVRYTHIIDPRTGRPVLMRGASVSVVHSSAAVADAWATALTVLGPDEGYALARREGLAALFVEPAPGGFQSLLTPALGDRFAVGQARGPVAR